MPCFFARGQSVDGTQRGIKKPSEKLDYYTANKIIYWQDATKKRKAKKFLNTALSSKWKFMLFASMNFKLVKIQSTVHY